MPSKVVSRGTRSDLMRSAARSLAVPLVLSVLSGPPMASSLETPSDPDEVLQRMEKLSQEVQACGQDLACLTAKAQELQKLSQAYQSLQGQEGAHPSIPDPAAEKARQKAVEDALADQKHDACYPVSFQKEYARRYVGSDLPWIGCVPLHIRLQWDVKESLYGRPPWTNEGATYKLTEEFPGYLQIAHNQETRSRIESFFVLSPSPPDSPRIAVDLEQISAHYPFSTDRWGGGRAQIVSTDDASHFSVTYGAGKGPILSLSYDELTQEKKGRIGASDVDPLFDLFADPSLDYAGAAGYEYGPVPRDTSGVLRTVSMIGDDVFSPAQIRQALSRGYLRFQHSITYSHELLGDGYRREGTVDVHIELGLSATRETIGPREECDPTCPVYCGRTAYDIEVNSPQGRVEIKVKVKVETVKEIPLTHVDSVRTPAGPVDIYVTDVAVGGARPQPSELSSDELGRLAELWQGEIEAAWNNRFKVHCNQRGGRTWNVHLTVDILDARKHPGADAHHTVRVRPGEGQSDQGNWFARSTDFVAHETAHFLGTNDEYKDRECPNRPPPRDRNIMDDPTAPPRGRHLEDIAKWMSKATGSRCTITR